ncbi:hypothetical protein EAF00_010064 [Botryotinia globosa]|nr:hypothetical protein EAF00_010064 [Botryotinia globosa]
MLQNSFSLQVVHLTMNISLLPSYSQIPTHSDTAESIPPEKAPLTNSTVLLPQTAPANHVAEEPSSITSLMALSVFRFFSASRSKLIKVNGSERIVLHRTNYESH